MRSTISILEQIKSSHPELQFEASDDFYWSPSNSTIYYRESMEVEDYPFLLHELSHALLGHRQYARDIQLVAIESQAWDKALQIAPQYNLAISQTLIDESLDSYRDWMHSRSHPGRHPRWCRYVVWQS